MVFMHQPDDTGVSITQSQVGKFGPFAGWKSSVTVIAWVLRRSQKGLQPVRPVVVWAQDVTLQPGKVLVLQ